MVGWMEGMMVGCMEGMMVGWVGGWMGVWLGGWPSGWMGSDKGTDDISHITEYDTFFHRQTREYVNQLNTPRGLNDMSNIIMIY